jgi:hypothetical protein
MLKDRWFSQGIVIKGARSGAVETLPEPYSAESAQRLATTYSSLWLEPVEWWGVESDGQERYTAVSKRYGGLGKRSDGMARSG